MRAPLLSNMDQIQLAYKRLGHKVASLHDVNPESTRMTLSECLSSGQPSGASFEAMMEVMNAESRVRFRPNETISEKMRALQLKGGDSEHKGSNTPPELAEDEFCIDVGRALQHFRSPYFYRETHGVNETKSPNGSCHMEHLEDFGLGEFDQYFEKFGDGEDFGSAGYFTNTNSSYTSITNSSSFASLKSVKSNEEGSTEAPGSAGSGHSHSTSSSSGFEAIQIENVEIKDELISSSSRSRNRSRGSSKEEIPIPITSSTTTTRSRSRTTSRSGSGSESSTRTRSRSGSGSDHSEGTEGSAPKKFRIV